MSKELWFSPLQVGTDFDDLLLHPERWEHARRLLTGISFYDLLLQDPRWFEHLKGLDAFRRLQNMGLKIGLETGAIKHWEKSGAAMAQRVTIPVIEAIEKAGGHVAQIAYEEPAYDGTRRLDDVTGQPLNCGYTLEQAANETAAYVQAVLTRFPLLIVGDMEPYPALSAAELLTWFTLVKQRIPSLAFVWLDCSRAPFTEGWAGDLRAIIQGCRDLGLNAGHIVTGNSWTATDDAGFYKDSLAWVAAIRDAKIVTSRRLYESWLEHPVLPQRNVPDSQAITFTALIIEGERLMAQEGKDFTMPSRYARTTGKLGDVNYVALGTPEPFNWLLEVECEKDPNKSCPGPTNRSFPINGVGSPVTLQGGLPGPMTLRVDHLTRPNPCGPGFFTFLALMHHTDEGGSLLPTPDKLMSSHRLTYNQNVPAGDNAARCIAGAQFWWDGKSHMIEIDLIASNWSDALPADPSLIYASGDWYGNGQASFHVLDGPFCGLAVDPEKEKVLVIDWSSIYLTAIHRQWVPKPTGPIITQALYIGIEVKGGTLAELKQSDFLVWEKGGRSVEHIKALIVDLYVHFLGREPEPGGAEYWLKWVLESKNLSGLVNHILDSPEYRDKHSELMAEVQQ